MKNLLAPLFKSINIDAIRKGISKSVDNYIINHCSKTMVSVCIDKLFLDDNNFIECTDTEGMDKFTYRRKEDTSINDILKQTVNGNFRHNQQYVMAYNNKIKYFRKYSNHDMDEYSGFLYDRFNNSVIGFRVHEYKVPL